MPSVIGSADCSRCVMRDRPEDERCIFCGGENFEDVFALASSLRSALCKYQLNYWTLAYRTQQFFKPLLGDDDEDWADDKGGA